MESFDFKELLHDFGLSFSEVFPSVDGLHRELTLNDINFFFKCLNVTLLVFLKEVPIKQLDVLNLIDLSCKLNVLLDMINETLVI